MRRVIQLLLVGLAPGLLLAAELVFNDGSTLKVKKAEVKGQFVWVTLEDGSMKAYPRAQVNLEASGLIKHEEIKPDLTPHKPKESLAEAARRISGKPAFVINDSDVGHVKPSQEAKGEEGKKRGKTTSRMGSLYASIQGYKLLGRQLTVNASITNVGEVPVTSVAVAVVAEAPGGLSLGEARQTIAEEIGPGETKNFTAKLQLKEGDLASVKVRIVGAVVKAKIIRPEEGGEAVPPAEELPPAEMEESEG